MPRAPKVDIVRPKTWLRYKPSMCDGCQAGCCTMPVVVTTEDLFHMGYLKASEVEGPLVRISQRLKREGLIKSYRSRSRTFVLRQVNGHDCLFLDKDRRCTIYEKRPHICRRFPLNSIRPGYCPSIRKEE